MADFQDARAMYDKLGIGGRVGFGNKAAVLVVDFSYGFTDPKASPMGADYGKEIAATKRLLDVTRPLDIPAIFFAQAFRADLKDGGVWPNKLPNQKYLTKGTRLARIDDRLEVQPGEVVIEKQAASAFFWTPLAAILAANGVDTIIVTGCVTSGCVRATVVDGVSYGYRVIVPEECVGDRHDAPHEANLFDMDTKYGDVLPLDSVIETIQRKWGESGA